MITVQGYVSGRVQGVGFRYFLKQQAGMAEVTGFTKNLDDGRVEFLLQGDENNVDNVVNKIRRGPAFSRIDAVDSHAINSAKEFQEFDIF